MSRRRAIVIGWLCLIDLLAACSASGDSATPGHEAENRGTTVFSAVLSEGDGLACAEILSEHRTGLVDNDNLDRHDADGLVLWRCVSVQLNADPLPIELRRRDVFRRGATGLLGISECVARDVASRLIGRTGQYRLVHEWRLDGEVVMQKWCANSGGREFWNLCSLEFAPEPWSSKNARAGKAGAGVVAGRRVIRDLSGDSGEQVHECKIECPVHSVDVLRLVVPAEYVDCSGDQDAWAAYERLSEVLGARIASEVRSHERLIMAVCRHGHLVVRQ